MAIAPIVEQELRRNRIPYRTIHHRPTDFSLESARTSRLAPAQVVKGVVLHDAFGYVLVLLTADAAVDLDRVRAQLGRELELARETDLGMLFHDCETGAVPALGPAYGVATWVDEDVMSAAEICFEGGDHRVLVCVAADDFAQLLGAVDYGRFTQAGFTASPRRSGPARPGRNPRRGGSTPACPR